MMLLHILPILMVIAAVTAALRAPEKAAFPREFLRAAGSLIAGFGILGAVVFILGRLL